MSTYNLASINTALFESPATADDPPTPQLTLSSTTSSTDTPHSAETPRTPTNQQIMSMAERERLAAEFVTELGLDWEGLTALKQYRAKRLMSEDFSWSPGHGDTLRYTTTFKKEFDTFVEKIEAMKRDEESKEDEGAVKIPSIEFSWLFFDEEAIENYLVIRKQRSGICCLHASVLLQHYLQCLRSADQETTNHRMLDISQFIRENLEPAKKKKYIETGACGLGSEEFFKTITGLSSTHQLLPAPICKKSLDEYFFYCGVQNVIRLFEHSQEPALVQQFAIEANFEREVVHDREVDEAEFRAFGESKGKQRVLHSMVLLGVRKVETEDPGKPKVWFLLQNFWENDYFHLVSAEYLASCTATITFAPPNVDISLNEAGNYSTVDGNYAETEIAFEECAPPLPEEG